MFQTISIDNDKNEYKPFAFGSVESALIHNLYSQM